MAWLSRALRALLHAANWGSNNAMVNVLFFVLIFFSLRFFLRLPLQLYRGVTIVRL